MPLDGAATHNNLGTTLQALSERESGTARLEEVLREVAMPQGETYFRTMLQSLPQLSAQGSWLFRESAWRLFLRILD